LTPAEVRKVFEAFLGFDKAYPNTARVHTLVMPSLPPSLKWMARDTDRVRKARPFYSPFPRIVAAGDAALRKNFMDEYPGELGDFVARSVEIFERVLPGEETAIHAFAAELEKAFPTLDASHKQVRAAFDALKTTVRGSAGVPLADRVLRQAVEAALNRELPIKQSFPLHIRSDRDDRDGTSLEIAASDFSGIEAGYPLPDRWQSGLVRPLQAVSTWLRQRQVGRVALSGSYRLTTAMVVGWSLRSAIGFELEIPTKEAPWATDDRPTSDMVLPNWEIERPTELAGGRLVVAIGVFRRPAVDLPRVAGVAKEAILAFHLPEAIRSAQAAQASAGLIKRTVDEWVAALHASGIDYYFAGPAALAVALGHRWNAMPSTQLHEYLASQGYVKTATI
jgi:hypothetical protein